MRAQASKDKVSPHVSCNERKSISSQAGSSNSDNDSDSDNDSGRNETTTVAEEGHNNVSSNRNRNHRNHHHQHRSNNNSNNNNIHRSNTHRSNNNMGVSTTETESPSVATSTTTEYTTFFPDATFGDAIANKRRSPIDQQEMLERIERILRFAQKRLKKSKVEPFYEKKKKKFGRNSDGNILKVQHSDVRPNVVLGNGSYNVVYSVKKIKGSVLDPNEIVIKTLRSKLLGDLPMLAACAADLRKEGLLLAALQQCPTKPQRRRSNSKMMTEAHPHAKNVIRCLAWTPTGLSAFANGCHDSFFLILEKLDRTLTDTLKEWRHLENNAVEQERHRERLRKGGKQQHGLKVSSRSILLSSVKNTFFSRDNSQRSCCSEKSYSQRSNSLSNSQRSESVHSHATSNSQQHQQQQQLDISDRDQSTNSSYSNSTTGNNNCFADPEQVQFWKLRLGLLMDLCGAVAFLHSQRVIHRDLKPDNVGFDRKGTLKVFDFDVSRVLPNQANWGDSRNECFKMTKKVGSPRYMSPEVAKGEHYNEKADVYALGLLAYEVLTLKRPFDSLNSKDRGTKGGNVYKDCVQVVVRGEQDEIPPEEGGRRQKRRNSFGNFAFRRNSGSHTTAFRRNSGSHCSTTNTTTAVADTTNGGGASGGKLGNMFRRRSHSRGSQKRSGKTRDPKYANIRPLLPVATPQEMTMSQELQHQQQQTQEPPPPQEHSMPARRLSLSSSMEFITNRNSSLKSCGSVRSRSSVRSHRHSVNDIDVETTSFFWTRALRTTIDQTWSYDIPTRPFACELKNLIGEELERIELHDDLGSCH